MRTTIEFLDAVRARHGLTSDYQLAKFLGISRERVSRYRTARDYLGEETALKVADALSIPQAHVLACVAGERAKNGEVKKAWRAAAAATAALLLAVALVAGDDGFYITSTPAHFIHYTTPSGAPWLELLALYLLALAALTGARCALRTPT